MMPYIWQNMFLFTLVNLTKLGMQNLQAFRNSGSNEVS